MGHFNGNRALAAILGAIAWSGCNALLGDLRDRPADAGTNGPRQSIDAGGDAGLFARGPRSEDDGGKAADAAVEASEGGIGTTDAIDATVADAGDAGACLDAAHQCSGNTPQTCADGQWVSGAPCNSDETCVDGTCGGVCGPGQTQCVTDTQVQTCGTSGQWVIAMCPSICVAGACQSGAVVSTGAALACAVLGGGVVECWGDNLWGGLGNGSSAGPDTCSSGFVCSTTPVTVSGLSGVAAVSTGDQLACALLSGGTVECWGVNYAGQLANGSSTGPDTCSSGGNARACSTSPVAVTGLSSVMAISAGEDSACALLSGGTVECWGDNIYGELGNGSTTGPDTCGGHACSTAPVPVSGLSGVTAISLGGNGEPFACALLSGGTVECWGANFAGQLGNGTTTSSSRPVAVSGLSGVTAISAGAGDSVCALLSGGTVECWGDNQYGELGNGSTTGPDTCSGQSCSTTPVAVSGLTGVTAISTSNGFACALLSGGTVECWGANYSGQLGNGSTTGPDECSANPCAPTPVAVAGLHGVTAISATWGSPCALLSSGTVECWGDNNDGELGNGTTSTTPSLTPVAVTW